MSANSSFDDCPYETILDLRTNLTTAQEYLYTPIEHLFMVTVLPLVLVLGTTGNLAFIYTVISVKSMKTVTNTYLTQVALADIIFVTLSCGTYLANYLLSAVRFDVPYRSFVGCMLTFHSIMSVYFASLFLITFVTIERYYAICRPLQHRMVTGKARTFKIIISSWILGVLFGACVTPRYSGFNEFCIRWPPNDDQYASLQTTIENCVTVDPDVYLFSEMVQTAPLFVAMAANIYMYTCILLALSRRPVDAVATEQNAPQTKRVRNQVARLLIINGTIFFICQSPFRFASIHNMLVHQTGTGLFTVAQYGSILLTYRILAFVNACVNPFVYVATSSIYRQAFLEAFMCSRRRTNGVSRAKSLTTQTQFTSQ